MDYSAKVMDHFAHPRNVGDLPDANAVGMVGNQKCGDIMKMMLKIEDGIIKDVKFQTFGCGRTVFEEVLQERCTGENLADALAKILPGGERREAVLQGMDEFTRLLGAAGAVSENVARIVAQK